MNLKQKALAASPAPVTISQAEKDRQKRDRLGKIEKTAIEKAKQLFDADFKVFRPIEESHYSFDGPILTYRGDLIHDDIVLRYSGNSENSVPPTFSFHAHCSYRLWYGWFRRIECSHKISLQVYSLQDLGRAIRALQTPHQHVGFPGAPWGAINGPMSQGKYFIDANGEIIIY